MHTVLYIPRAYRLQQFFGAPGTVLWLLEGPGEHLDAESTRSRALVEGTVGSAVGSGHGLQLRAGIPWFPVKGGTTWVRLQHLCDTRAHNNAAVRHSLFSLWALMHFLQHQAKSHIPQVRTEPSLQLQELLKSQKQQQCKSWSTGLEMPAEERFSCSAPELAFPSTDLP